MISLSPIRALNLRTPFGPERPAFLSAASGLVVAGEFIYVVADDELMLGVFPREGGGAGQGVRMLPGELPLKLKQRKRLKPDFEVLLRLPSFDGYPDGGLLVLASGSRPSRYRGVLLPLDAKGNLDTGAPCEIDLSSLYAELLRYWPALNIEAAVVIGDQLWMFQRANASDSTGGRVALCLTAVLAGLAKNRTMDASMVIGIAPIELGQVRGIALGFTDATTLQNGHVLFCAVAEDCDDAYADGPCVGASIGLLDPNARVCWMHSLEPLYKVEGIAASIVDDTIHLLAVTDADDASIAACLLTGEVQLLG